MSRTYKDQPEWVKRNNPKQEGRYLKHDHINMGREVKRYSGTSLFLKDYCTADERVPNPHQRTSSANPCVHVLARYVKPWGTDGPVRNNRRKTWKEERVKKRKQVLSVKNQFNSGAVLEILEETEILTDQRQDRLYWYY